MKTSLIITSYNKSRRVTDTVNSALNQTTAFDEILVIDDASNDGSSELLQKKFGKNSTIRLIPNSSNQGQIKSLQNGFNHSTGDIIYLLDGDDFIFSHHVETTLKEFRDDNELDFVTTDYSVLASKTDKTVPFPPFSFSGRLKIATAYSEIWPATAFCATAAIRRTAFQKILPTFNGCTSLTNAHGDIPIALGLFISNAKYKFINSTNAYYYRDTTNHSAASYDLHILNDFIYKELIILEKCREYYIKKFNLEKIILQDILNECKSNTFSSPENAFKVYSLIANKTLDAGPLKKIIYKKRIKEAIFKQ